MGLLPDWLQQIAATCTEQERQQLNQRLDMTSEREMKYRAAQAERGQKMVRLWVPADKVEEYKTRAAADRLAHKKENGK